MRTARRMAARRAGHSLGIGFLFLLLTALAVRLGETPARAQDGADGLFITVHNPITSERVQQIKDKTERARERWRAAGRTGKIVYDFNPDGRPAATGEYDPCRGLAKYLLSLQDVHTIAFVHHEVTRHTVLPVLACKDVVMADDGKTRLGDILRNQPETLEEDEKLFYRKAVRHEGLWPLVRKMFDRNIEVLEGRKNDSVWYVVKGEVPEGVVVTRPEPVLPANAVGLYDARQAQKLGLCKLIRDTRQQVAEAYQLPASSLREDPLEGRTPVAWRIEVKGPVNRALDETLRRRIRRAVGAGANLIFLQLNCGGGDTVVARDLAKFLSTLKDDQGQYPVMTVAYIPQRAPDTATFLALGCTEIVMGKDPTTGKEAELGDFENLVTRRHGERREPVDEKNYELLRQTLVGLAEEQGYSPLLAQGMLDRNLVIHRVRSKANPAERFLVRAEDLQQDKAREQPQWIDEGIIKPAGEFLKLSASRARDLNVARHVVGSADELLAKYEVSRAREAGPDWIDALAAFLRQPGVAVFLVMLGIVCLTLELKMPGIGLPGILAALCFILFFWAHSFDGQITLLAVMLFLLGLVLLGLEIFVIPGFGITGISGIILLVLSLGLATLEKKPETTQEWVSFGSTLTVFGLCLVGAVMAALFIGRYLPNIPYANRLVLAPPDERSAGLEEAPAVSPQAAALLGAMGVAVTNLRPAGMAQFGDAYVDVVAEGSFVAAGGRVQVIEIEANRIVVKEV
jgi:membrane-bound ClpP family serine protease